jgi:hypothetical protein
MAVFRLSRTDSGHRNCHMPMGEPCSTDCNPPPIQLQGVRRLTGLRSTESDPFKPFLLMLWIVVDHGRTAPTEAEVCLRARAHRSVRPTDRKPPGLPCSSICMLPWEHFVVSELTEVGCQNAVAHVRQEMAGTGFTRISAVSPAKTTDSIPAMRSGRRRAAAPLQN